MEKIRTSKEPDMDAYFRMERAHRIFEKYGGERRKRVFVEVQAGVPIFFETSFDGDNLRVHDSEVLPTRFAGPLRPLCELVEIWIDKVPNQNARRAYNIVVANEVLERLVRSIKGRALSCSGTHYIMTTAVGIMSGVLHKIGNLPHRATGTDVDAVMADAGLRINDLLMAAGCTSPLPMAA
jgi:hypothetical protein